MNIEIPEFLIEMSKQMNNQNNRMTADPLFEVRYTKSLITESDYNESHFEICEQEEGLVLYHSERDDSYKELAEHLSEYHKKWCASWCEENDVELNMEAFLEYFPHQYDHDGWQDLPDGVKKFHMQEVEVTVNSHFTEAGAQAFIDRKQHDYPKLYIYAISMCYSYQMIELRDWIKSIDGGE